MIIDYGTREKTIQGQTVQCHLMCKHNIGDGRLECMLVVEKDDNHKWAIKEKMNRETICVDDKSDFVTKLFMGDRSYTRKERDEEVVHRFLPYALGQAEKIEGLTT